MYLPSIRGTSEESEASELEHSTRRIQVCLVYFCLGIIWKVILKKEVRNKFTKIYQADLDSPRRELSNSSLGIVVVFFWFVGKLIFRVCLLGVQSSCIWSQIVANPLGWLAFLCQCSGWTIQLYDIHM